MKCLWIKVLKIFAILHAAKDNQTFPAGHAFNIFSEDGKEKLKKEAINSEEDLPTLTEANFTKLNLKIGDQNRLFEFVGKMKDKNNTGTFSI